LEQPPAGRLPQKRKTEFETIPKALIWLELVGKIACLMLRQGSLGRGELPIRGPMIWVAVLD
jgi:hypothetical protein